VPDFTVSEIRQQYNDDGDVTDVVVRCKNGSLINTVHHVRFTVTTVGVLEVSDIVFCPDKKEKRGRVKIDTIVELLDTAVSQLIAENWAVGADCTQTVCDTFVVDNDE